MSAASSAVLMATVITVNVHPGPGLHFPTQACDNTKVACFNSKRCVYTTTCYVDIYSKISTFSANLD